MILSGGLLSGSIAMNNTSALSGQFTGFLNSGDAFTVSFTQAAPNQISVVNSSVVPVPGAVWLLGSALGVMGWVRRKSVT